MELLHTKYELTGKHALTLQIDTKHGAELRTFKEFDGPEFILDDLTENEIIDLAHMLHKIIDEITGQ